MQAQYLGIALHSAWRSRDWKKAQKKVKYPEGYMLNSALRLRGYYGVVEL